MSMGSSSLHCPASSYERVSAFCRRPRRGQHLAVVRLSFLTRLRNSGSLRVLSSSSSLANGRGAAVFMRRGVAHPVLARTSGSCLVEKLFNRGEQRHSAIFGQFLDANGSRAGQSLARRDFRRLRKLAGLESARLSWLRRKYLPCPFTRRSGMHLFTSAQIDLRADSV